MHQMVLEGALWPSVMVRFRLHWCNSKMTLANISNAIRDVRTKNATRLLVDFSITRTLSNLRL